jgi:TPR repeat protein
MPNDTGLTCWSLMLPIGSNEHIPCFQHSKENKAIIVSWDDVPELQLSKWSTQGYVEAIFQYGKVLLEKGEYENAWQLFLKGAENNDKFCVFYLGVMLGEGLGRQINAELAFKKYLLAADLGHLDSQYNVAQAYLRGNNTGQNFQKALYYFDLAAMQGDPESNYNLGIFYFVGDQIPRDLKKAHNYFELALINGFSQAEEYINKIKTS